MLMNDWRHFKEEDDPGISKDRSPSRRDASPSKAATMSKRDKSPLDRTVRDSGKREKSPSDRPIRESGGDGAKTPEPKDGGKVSFFFFCILRI